MEQDYDYSSTVYLARSGDAAALGRSAGERAVKRLNPKKAQTTKVPIVFRPAHFVLAGRAFPSARSTAPASPGAPVSSRTEWSQAVFNAGIEIVDDPHRARGLRSKPFDGEGLATRRHVLAENGVLKTWISIAARPVSSV